ncbi:hypothetical protein [Xanthomonas oryzae]|uniref:Uncharacterized protein n=1 Tax=Xanthomonas oryzae pv. leersiae TaxID=3112258 RepID=A0AAJ6KKD7_9XANT|nr:hypothetical protein [Xanthomonas oryzae]WIX05158.1 hypothetical protein QN060_12770 [Xanthomonas oryzae pv. oryzae]
MRELTNEELFLVAGAAAAADVDPSEPPTEIPPIVVNPPPSPPPTIPPSPPVEQPGPISPPGGGGTPPPTAPEYDLNFTRALTAEESAALVKFDDAIYFVKDSISSLPDNAYMQMSDGSTVQMSEIKSLMLNADYKVNEAGTSYSNGFATGQSDYNNGDPQISINIDTIKGYSDLMGGANFLVMHELAHNDVPPILSSTSVWSPIPYPEEIGREEAFFRRADHWLPARSRGRHGNQGSMPTAWLQ